MSLGSVYETAYRGDYNQVKVKVDEDIALINTPDSNQRLLIHWASLGGNENLVDFLINSGSPVDPLDDTNSTPLILSSSAGRVEVVKLLLSKGADVNKKTIRGQSSLHYACSKGHLAVSKLLINFDANVNDTDVLSATPLHCAAAQGRSNIVELLLTSPQIKVDVCDSTGSTPLATLKDALHQIRVERQITQRRIAALPTSARQELVARKREAHLERMLMPDAPPRKRQTKRLSPERRPCIMVDQSAQQSVDIGSEVVVATSSSPYIFPASKIGVQDENFEGVMTDWLQLTDLSDNDDDLDIDVDECDGDE